MNKPDTPQATQPRPRRVDIQPREQVYVYHWDRILSVAAVLLLLLGFTAYGLYAWLSSDSSQNGRALAEVESQVKTVSTDRHKQLVEEQLEPAAAASTSLQENQDEVTKPINLAADIGAVQETADQALKTDTLPQTAEPSPPIDSTTQEATEGLEVKQTKPETATLPQVSEDKSEPITQASQTHLQTAASAPTPAAQPQDQSVSLETDAPTTPPRAGSFQLKEVKILAPRVERFELARTVSNKEPRGEISEITFKADGAAAVWCYSEVVDKPGSVLRYVWFHAGKRMAQVRVDVRGKRWRSHSSKIINQQLTGAWRVELQDGAGQLLASADFELL